MTRELYTVSSNGFTANADAFVLGEHNEQVESLWLLSVIGTQAAVRAITAGALKRDAEIVSLRKLADLSDEPDPASDRTYAIRTPESGAWKSRLMRLPFTRGWHGLIYSTQLEYNSESPGFVLLAELGVDDAADRHLQFINRRISLPIYPAWKYWLWYRGITKGEITPMTTAGLSAWQCTPGEDALRTDITADIQAGILTAESVSDDMLFEEVSNGETRIAS